MIKTKKYLPGIAWFFLVLILLCLPGSEFPKKIDLLDKIQFDKWVHMGLFGILAYLWMMPVVKGNLTSKNKLQLIIKIALAISVWGITTEFIQKYFIPHRSFDIFDWAADTVGAFIALFFWKNKVTKTYNK